MLFIPVVRLTTTQQESLQGSIQVSVADNVKSSQHGTSVILKSSNLIFTAAPFALFG